MATCINRDLSLGVDRSSAAVLDWLSIKTCQQQKSVLSHVSLRPPDVRGQAHRFDVYWLPGFMRVEAVAARTTALGVLQTRGAAWGPHMNGWYSSFLWARQNCSAVVRVTRNSRTVTLFSKREGTSNFPITIRQGFGVTHYVTPNLHYGISLAFPRSLTACVCADVYRRWTASVSYSYSALVASARFAGNLATKADSVFEMALQVKVPKIWDLITEASTAHISWTMDGLAIGAALHMDSGQMPGYNEKVAQVGGGMPICLTVSALFPIGQPLGSVEAVDISTRKGPQLFFGLELLPWVGNTNNSAALEDDPLGILPRSGNNHLSNQLHRQERQQLQDKDGDRVAA